MAADISLNPEELSKEELIKLLRETQTDLNNTQNELKTTKVELKKSEEKNISLEEQLTGVQKVTAEGLRQLSELTQNLNKRVIILDDVLSKDLLQQLELSYNELIEWVQNARSWFNLTPFKKGRDVSGSKKAVDEAKSSHEKLHGSIKQAGKSIDKVTNAIASVIKTMSDNGECELGGAAKKINSYITPKRDSYTPKKSKGRVAKQRPISNTVSSKLFSHKCKCCGGNTVTYDTGTMAEEVIGASNRLNELLSLVKNIHEVEVCEKCGHASIAISDMQDVPVVPNREIGIDYILYCFDFMCRGMPLNNFIKNMKEQHEFGNDTFSYTLHDYVRIYLKPLYDNIIIKAKQAPVLLLDGTVFDCLESQGKKKSKTAKKPENAQISKENWILSMSSPAHAKVQFTAYDYLAKRNFESISKVITSDYQFHTLVTDGFSGYQRLQEEHPGVKLQNCLTHIRRYLLEGFDFYNYARQLEVLSDEECRQFIKKDIEENSDKYLLYTAFNAINKIYELEASVDYSREDYLEQIKKIRKESRVLIENADKVMDEMVKRHMVESKKGLVGKKGDPYARATVYWYQRRPYIKAFLDDPTIPIDSNIVEQAIRPLTVLRKNCNFKATIEYMQDLCMMYSVFMTAKKNGITDVYSYLRKYSRDLYQYCLEKQWTVYIKEGKSLTKKINTWDMVNLSIGFDFSQYQLIK